jgi:hypothetical protein
LLKLINQYKMIKNIVVTGVLFICISLGVSSCSKVNCDDLTIAIETGTNAYKLSASNTNCLNYKKALQAWLNESECSDANSVQTNIYKSTLQTITASCP